MEAFALVSAAVDGESVASASSAAASEEAVEGSMRSSSPAEDPSTDVTEDAGEDVAIAANDDAEVPEDNVLSSPGSAVEEALAVVAVSGEPSSEEVAPPSLLLPALLP